MIVQNFLLDFKDYFSNGFDWIINLVFISGALVIVMGLCMLKKDFLGGIIRCIMGIALIIFSIYLGSPLGLISQTGTGLSH